MILLLSQETMSVHGFLESGLSSGCSRQLPTQLPPNPVSPTAYSIRLPALGGSNVSLQTRANI